MFAISKYEDDSNKHLFECTTIGALQLWLKTAEKTSYIVWHRQPNSWISMLYVNTVGQTKVSFM